MHANPGMMIFSVAFGALWAWVCYRMAKKRGRNEVGWAIAGFCFGLFAIAAMAIANVVRNHKKKGQVPVGAPAYGQWAGQPGAPENAWRPPTHTGFPSEPQPPTPSDPQAAPPPGYWQPPGQQPHWAGPQDQPHS